jgi:hypothetical protein
MTWTPDLLHQNPASPPHEHDQPGAEVAPGVLVERRSVLWLSASAATAFLLGQAPRLESGQPRSDGRLDWKEFLDEGVPLARELFQEKSPAGQDAYLQRLAALAVRLKAAPDTRLFPYGKLEPKVEFAPSFRGVPFLIIQWRMHARAVLPAHCHPSTSVCTLGLEGEARLRNFEIEGEAPAFNSGSKRTFLIRETHSQLITAGRVNTLSPTRDNIHYFEAGPDGARGIDITTPYGGNGDFSFLAFEPDRPKDARRRVFEAAWAGQKP